MEVIEPSKKNSFSRTVLKVPTQKDGSWKGLFIPARILVLGFLAAIFIGALLLHLPVASQSGEQVPFIDTLFTATSAVCVTGLVTVDTGTTYTRFGQI